MVVDSSKIVARMAEVAGDFGECGEDGAKFGVEGGHFHFLYPWSQRGSTRPESPDVTEGNISCNGNSYISHLWWLHTELRGNTYFANHSGHPMLVRLFPLLHPCCCSTTSAFHSQSRAPPTRELLSHVSSSPLPM